MVEAAHNTAPGSLGTWKLFERDFTLRESLVAGSWARDHLKAWNAVFAEGKRRGNSAYYGPALVEMEISDADKRAEWAYRACCEIWEIQGRVKARPFFRAVFDFCLQPMFAVREGCFQSKLEQHQKRTGTGMSQDLSAIVGHFKREMGKLRAKWNTTLEIATRDTESRDRARLERERGQKSQAPAPLIQPSHVEGLGPAFTWRDLEARFLGIEKRNEPPKNVHAVFIRTEWTSGSIDEDWTLSGNMALRTEFENLCTIAARKLGLTSVDHLYENWLGHVRDWTRHAGLDKDRNYVWHSTGTVTENGANGTTQGWSSERIAELSAHYCTYLIAQHIPEQPEASAGVPQRLRSARQSAKPSRRTQVIFGAIQAGLKGLRYCAELDRRKLQPLASWAENGWPGTYVSAYKDPNWQKPIQDEKTRHTRKYAALSSREQEAIIQGESRTRRTR